MRGTNRRGRVSQASAPVMDSQLALTGQLPAPYGGWNARGNLSNMPPLDAVVLDNIFPGVQEVSLRKGMVEFKTGFTDPVHSLLVYNGPTASKLFAATDSGIFDSTTAGVVGASVASCTYGYWHYINFATAGGSFLLAVNGVDNLKLYDGTTWTTITGASVPAITGLSTDAISTLNIHKKRVWFVEEDSMSIWYLPAESIAGAATEFPVGSLFRKGGKVVSIGSWTLDGGTGSDDYFVIVTSNGEIAVYQGTDPASSSTWALVGVYDAGIPVGKKPLLDFGGDLLYLSRNGLFPLSKLLQSTIIDRSTAFSYKIDGAFLSAAETYAGNNSWEMLAFRAGNFLVVNIPVSNDTLSHQYVMNTITGAWCRFTGWNAFCWALVGSDLFFGGVDGTYQAWTGTSDNGETITGTWMQAYNSLGFQGQTSISLVRPNFSLAGNANVIMAFDADFKTFGGQTSLTYTDGMAGSYWDSALWDTDLWPGGVTAVEPKWTTIPNQPGYLHAFRGQISTTIASFSWTSINYAVQRLGIL